MINFTRISNDTNGNPRYVSSFLNLLTSREHIVTPPSEKYALAVERAHKIGGKKYHTKKYGGGIVFQSYNIRDTAEAINEQVVKASLAELRHTPPITLVELPDETLRLVWTGDEFDREDVASDVAKYGAVIALFNALDYYSCNGWEVGSADRYGGLSDAPVILFDVAYDDDGYIVGWERGWWSPNYCVIDELEEILSKGYFDFAPIGK